MRILVTGGAGFIGSHLSEALMREGHEVSLLDDLNDFYAPELKRRNLAAIQRAGPVRLYECDIRHADAVAAAFDDSRPEAVIHLAARAGVRPSLENPLLYEEVNVRGTMILLEACRRFTVRKMIFASSSSVYGATNRVPFSEADPVDHPISPYAATKIAGERICYTYSHLYGLRVVCLRFFTVYGPRQRPDLAIRKFTNLIDESKPVPVFGDGSSGRDYTYIDDIVRGILAALHLECAYEVFNLGNSHPVPLRTLITTIEKAMGKAAILKYLPDQPGDVPLTYADIGHARKLLGYSPAVPFEEGIQRFARWHLAERQT